MIQGYMGSLGTYSASLGAQLLRKEGNYERLTRYKIKKCSSGEASSRLSPAYIFL